MRNALSTCELISRKLISREDTEPHRTKAYSNDLRWRMVWQREVLECSYKDISMNLNVDLSTVWRVVKTFRETGCVNKKGYPRVTFLVFATQSWRYMTLKVNCMMLLTGFPLASTLGLDYQN